MVLAGTKAWAPRGLGRARAAGAGPGESAGGQPAVGAVLACPRPRGPAGTAPQPSPGDAPNAGGPGHAHVGWLGGGRVGTTANRVAGPPAPRGRRGHPSGVGARRGVGTGEEPPGGHTRLLGLPPLPGRRRLPRWQPGAATPGRRLLAARSRRRAAGRRRSAVTGLRGGRGGGARLSGPAPTAAAGGWIGAETRLAMPRRGAPPSAGDWAGLAAARRVARGGAGKRAEVLGVGGGGVKRGGVGLGLRPGNPHWRRHSRGAGEDSLSGTGRSCAGPWYWLPGVREPSLWGLAWLGPARPGPW